MSQTLDKVQPGQQAVVNGLIISCSPELGARLEALGFMKGNHVKVVRNAPLGDPVMYRVSDQVLCLRKREAAMVEVDLAA